MKQVFSAGMIIFLFAAAAMNAVGYRLSDLSSPDFVDVFCGMALPAFNAEPVVLPPHEDMVTVDVAITGFAFVPPDLTINNRKYWNEDRLDRHDRQLVAERAATVKQTT